MGGEKGGRCREGMASEKGAKEEEERGKKGERGGRRRGEVKQHAVAGIKSDKIITRLKWARGLA